MRVAQQWDILVLAALFIAAASVTIALQSDEQPQETAWQTNTNELTVVVPAADTTNSSALRCGYSEAHGA